MKKILAIILVLAGLAIGFFCIPTIMPTDMPDDPSYLIEDDEAVTEKLSMIAEESVLEYDYTNAVILSDSDIVFKRIKVPFSSKNIVMVYDGKMKIGADISEVEAFVDKGIDGKVHSITVSLPKMKITSNEIDRESIEFPVEKGSIINQLKNSDYDDLEKKAKKEIEKTVKKSETMEQAREELEESITGFLQGLYGENIEVSFQ